jgi:hypothetical protein
MFNRFKLSDDRRWAKRLALSLALVALTTLAGIAYGQQVGTWPDSGYQVLNLGSHATGISAQILDPGGEQVYAHEATIPIQQARYFDPEEGGLPPGLRGTFRLEAQEQVAAAVVHFARPPYDLGNEIFEVVPEETLGEMAYFPLDSCTEVAVYLPGESDALLSISAYDPEGEQIGSIEFDFLAGATDFFWPVLELGLGPEFLGGGLIEADQPLLVTVYQGCDRLGAFMAPGKGAMELAMPLVLPDDPQTMTSTLKVLNMSPALAEGEIWFSNDKIQPILLPPWGSAVVNSLLDEGPGWAFAFSNEPIAIVVSVDSADGASSWAYRAFDLSQATPNAALPVILQGDGGWFTEDLWVQNVGAEDANLTAFFVAVPSGALEVVTDIVIPPGASQPLPVPSLGSSQAAAWIEADQPLVAVAPVFNPDPEVGDQYMLCRGSNYVPSPSHWIFLPVILKNAP